MDQTSNIPAELQRAASSPMKINPQDPEVVEQVKAFLRDKSSDSESPEAKSADGSDEIKVKPVMVQPDDDFPQHPDEGMISDALAMDPTVKVSDLEREIFLKAVLNDEPVRLTIDLYGGRLRVELRSRSTYEQRRVFDVVELDRKEGLIDKDNIAMLVTRTQYYMAVLMVERVNGKLFSDLKLKPDGDLAVDAAKMRSVVAREAEGLVGVRWNSILTALRYFEHKCARMNTEALNEGFWKPQGSV